MALPDPIPTLTVNAVEYDFVRAGMDLSSGVFRTANGNDVLTLSSSYKNRNRLQMRLDRKKTAADPFDSDLNQEYSWSTYVVHDFPKLGVTAAECHNLFLLLSAFAVEGTVDNGLRFLQGEL